MSRDLLDSGGTNTRKEEARALLGLVRAQMDQFVQLVKDGNDAVAKSATATQALQSEIQNLQFSIRELNTALDLGKTEREKLEKRIVKLERAAARGGSPEAKATATIAKANAIKIVIMAIAAAIALLIGALGIKLATESPSPPPVSAPESP
jgi:DNA repair ATPase RecN